MTSLAGVEYPGTRLEVCGRGRSGRIIARGARRSIGDRAVVAIGGEVDLATAPDLRSAIDAVNAIAFEIFVFEPAGG